MSTCLALLRRAAIADLRVNRDEGRTSRIQLGLLNRSSDRYQVIAVRNIQCLETKRFHALLHILRKCDVRASLDRNTVAVIQNDQFAEPEGSRQRERLGRNSLHHAAVTAKSEGVVIDNRVTFLIKYSRQMRLCHRHADRHAHACA